MAVAVSHSRMTVLGLFFRSRCSFSRNIGRFSTIPGRDIFVLKKLYNDNNASVVQHEPSEIPHRQCVFYNADSPETEKISLDNARTVINTGV